MYREEIKNKKGEIKYVVVERYIDPITNKTRRASVRFSKNTVRARREAERDLLDKIDKLIANRKKLYRGDSIKTFGELRKKWFDNWQTTVKIQTVHLEIVILDRLSELVADDTLLDKITPLFIQNCLVTYKEKYQSTFSTMQHIKSTLNRIFDYAVLYNAIAFSPSRVVRMHSTVSEKIAAKDRREAKFLNQAEIKILLDELKQRRNQNYYDLALFLLGTGCRIGEASAIMESDIDFQQKIVKIDKSLQAHDLTVDNYYLDSTKTEAGERIEQLPEFVIDALKRVIKRNNTFTVHMKNSPHKSFRETPLIFKTEYGAPITSKSFRHILKRINMKLEKTCLKNYGFEWKKNVVPHSFRHIHISILRNDPSVPIKEVQMRVGHVEEETTNIYTHLLNTSQEKSVRAIDSYMEKIVTQ